MPNVFDVLKEGSQEKVRDIFENPDYLLLNDKVKKEGVIEEENKFDIEEQEESKQKGFSAIFFKFIGRDWKNICHFKINW